MKSRTAKRSVKPLQLRLLRLNVGPRTGVLLRRLESLWGARRRRERRGLGPMPLAHLRRRYPKPQTGGGLWVEHIVNQYVLQIRPRFDWFHLSRPRPPVLGGAESAAALSLGSLDDPPAMVVGSPSARPESDAAPNIYVRTSTSNWALRATQDRSRGESRANVPRTAAPRDLVVPSVGPMRGARDPIATPRGSTGLNQPVMAEADQGAGASQQRENEMPSRLPYQRGPLALSWGPVLAHAVSRVGSAHRSENAVTATPIPVEASSLNSEESAPWPLAPLRTWDDAPASGRSVREIHGSEFVVGRAGAPLVAAVDAGSRAASFSTARDAPRSTPSPRDAPWTAVWNGRTPLALTPARLPGGAAQSQGSVAPVPNATSAPSLAPASTAQTMAAPGSPSLMSRQGPLSLTHTSTPADSPTPSRAGSTALPPEVPPTPSVLPPAPEIDIERVADEVYMQIEDRLRVEIERQAR